MISYGEFADNCKRLEERFCGMVAITAIGGFQIEVASGGR